MRLGPRIASACLIAAGVVWWALAPAGAESSPAGTAIAFRNVAPGSGVDFVLENCATPEKHVIETMPGGVAIFDYDGDGRPDIFFANGAAVPSLVKNAPKFRNRLYRNLGGMKFQDVTEQAGLAGAGYSIGASAADFDNDGHVDLFVAGVKSNHLYRNLGDGRFEEVTARAGIRSDAWSITGGWFDYDNDGYLDLLAVNYLQWSPEYAPFCGDPGSGIRAYCHPRFYAGLPNTLYHNRGDGTFEDVSAKSGIASQIGKGMSVAFADYDGDGRPDAYVTNDQMPGFLFHNLGGGRFAEAALDAGAALLDTGRPVSGMGVDFRDYDNDGRPDLAITDLAGETFPLFRNQGGGAFADATYSSRIAPLTRNRSGWSVGLFDFDNDGWKDLFTANGHVNDTVEHFEAARYKLANSVFLNRRDGTFRDVSAAAGADFQAPRAHRGAAFADLDGDGRIDVVVSSLGEPAEVWRNVTAGQNSYIEFKLRGTRSNRDGIGARIRLANQDNEMTSSVGYASSSHAAVHFGLGKAASVDRVEIRWPSGIVQVLRNVRANRVVPVVEPAR